MMSQGKLNGRKRKIKRGLKALRQEDERLYLELSILHKRARKRITEHYREPRTIAFM